MGNVMAASPVGAPSPPMSPPTGTSVPAPPPPGSTTPPSSMQPPEMPEEHKPGPFEDLHKKCKDIFPMTFDGAKLVVNKGLSNHFQVSHTLTMSNLTPSGYRFGSTYIGTKQTGPAEAFPVLVSELDPSGNLNAHIIHAINKKFRCKVIAQIQKSKLVNSQLSTEYRGEDSTSSLTLANVDLLSSSGVIVGQYLQRVTERLDLGAEMVYQYDSRQPGGEMGLYTLAGRYTKDNWQVSGNITPLAAGVHLCYYQKANDSLQVGVELEGSLRTQECTATIGYQLDLQNCVFRGQVDSNWNVGAVMEKKLPPLPCSFLLSALLNHTKGAYRFGVGLMFG